MSVAQIQRDRLSAQLWQRARYFAGFPIGFNVAIGGQKDDGSDASNELSYLFLRAQALLLLPQPNLRSASSAILRRSCWRQP